MAGRGFELTTELPASAEAVYAWHARPGALERMLPPWEKIRVLQRAGTLEIGRVVLAVPLGPFRVRWVARHHNGRPGRQFVDEQIEGPFVRWVHTHLFEPLGSTRCRMVDRVEYELAAATGPLIGAMVAARLRRTFRYRHETLRQDLATLGRYPDPEGRPVVISGATGLIGRQLASFLSAAGYRVRRLVRGHPGPDDIPWDPSAGRLDAAALEGADAVIHLGGAPVGEGRWSARRKQEILESRVRGTSLLAETLARLRQPPRVLVSASAVGVYGDRSDEEITERAGIRTGVESLFLEQVAQAWESATDAARRAGIRVVLARIGMVLSPAGGALQRMLTPFQAGVGGRLGSGSQYVSWIAMDDLLAALYHLLHAVQLSGPVNLTAPAPVTNAEFTRVLGRVLRRPTVFPVPAWALRLVLGEMADQLVLASQRVIPQRLTDSGYEFRYPELEGALRHGLGR
jgi:uncharacterized protein (TIGR01777 family)